MALVAGTLGMDPVEVMRGDVMDLALRLHSAHRIAELRREHAERESPDAPD